MGENSKEATIKKRKNQEILDFILKLKKKLNDEETKNYGLYMKLYKENGKGTIQELIPLDNSASLKLTIAKWLTPNETDINETGIIPDIEIQNSTSSDKDLQLEKAIEIINTI